MSGTLERFFKTLLFSFVRKLMRSEMFRQEIYRVIGSQAKNRHIIGDVTYRPSTKSYPELGTYGRNDTADRKDIVFISARFRSGSTLLWNIFRNLPGFKAYYEPLLHEPPRERGQGRNYTIDPTHKAINDYHREFMTIPGLDEVHHSHWAFRSLKMDQHFFAPELETYLNTILANTMERPVFQFNRVDFRLQWLKTHFRFAKIIHLYRNPRDQWMSMIRNDVFIPKNYLWDKSDLYPPLNTFFLFDWWKDLHTHMPFLDLDPLRHPYQVHYLIWRLSYLYGKQFSDLSIRYESLIDNFSKTMKDILILLKVEKYDIDLLSTLIKPRRLETWRQYAGDDWFKMMETDCEQLLPSFFYSQHTKTI